MHVDKFPDTFDISVSEDELPNRGMFLLWLSNGSNAWIKEVGYGRFSEWCQVIAMNSRTSFLEFWDAGCEDCVLPEKIIQNSSRIAYLLYSFPRTRTSTAIHALEESLADLPDLLRGKQTQSVIQCRNRYKARGYSLWHSDPPKPGGNSLQPNDTEALQTGGNLAADEKYNNTAKVLLEYCGKNSIHGTILWLCGAKPQNWTDEHEKNAKASCQASLSELRALALNKSCMATPKEHRKQRQ